MQSPPEARIQRLPRRRSNLALRAPKTLLGLAPILALGACSAAPPQRAETALVVPGPRLETEEPAHLERLLVAMGTGLTVQLEGASRKELLRASERAVRAIEAVERRLSTWDETSELSQLNSSEVGTGFALSPESSTELRRALAIASETGGAFDPTVGALVEVWGLRAGGRLPSEADLARALSGVGPAGLSLTGQVATRLHGDCRIEEGAFGKGAGLDAALAALVPSGASPIPRGPITRGTLDLGGQLILVPAETPYVLGVRHPFDGEAGGEVLELRLRSGSVATSGNSERAVVIDGERSGHLLDPRTGRPASNFGSVTVWAEQAIDADAYATALFVLGPEEGLAFALRTPGLEALFLLGEAGGLTARATPGFRDRVTVLDASILELTFAAAG